MVRTELMEAFSSNVLHGKNLFPVAAFYATLKFY